MATRAEETASDGVRECLGMSAAGVDDAEVARVALQCMDEAAFLDASDESRQGESDTLPSGYHLGGLMSDLAVIAESHGHGGTIDGTIGLSYARARTAVDSGTRPRYRR